MSEGIALASFMLAVLHIYFSYHAVGHWVDTNAWPRGTWNLTAQAAFAWQVIEAGRLTDEMVPVAIGAVWAGAATWILAGRINND